MHRHSYPLHRQTGKKVALIFDSLDKTSTHQAVAKPSNRWHGLIGSLALFVATFGHTPAALAQAQTPFTCDPRNFVSGGDTAASPNRLFSLDTTNFNLTELIGPSQLNGTDIKYNAIGFNPLDGFIYAIDPTIPGSPESSPLDRTIYRIGADGSFTPLGIPNFPPPANNTGFFFAGDVDKNGNYVVLNQDTDELFSFNVSGNQVVPLNPTAIPLVFNGQAPNFADIAFNPVDDLLYGFDSVRGEIASIDPNTGVVTFLPGVTPAGLPPGLVGGGIFFNAFGELFAYTARQTPGGVVSEFFSVNLATGDSTPLQPTQGVSRFDGARCAIAPEFRKQVAPQTVTAGGTVTYTYTLPNITIDTFDDLSLNDTLPQPAGFTDALTFVPGTLNINGFVSATPNAFGGTSTLDITNLTLPPNTTGTISIDVKLSPSTPPGTQLNQATVNDLPPQFSPPNNPGVLESDDPETPEFPDETPLVVTENPAIGVAKRVVSFSSINDTTFRVNYEIVVENAGNVPLNGVQLSENLDGTFGAGNFSFVSLTNPNLAINNAFDGTVNNQELLAANQTLAVGQSETLQLIVDVTPVDPNANYTNQVEATGTSPNGQPVDDLSDDGVDPDPNDNGNTGEPGEDDPTVINFAENPAIGVAKNITSIVSNGDGSFAITYGLVVENIGNVVLNNVQLEENLDGTFGAGNFTVTSLTSSTLTPNPNFDASTDINLLAETDTLAVGDSANVQLVVNVTPPDLNADYENQVRATGTSPGGTPVDDLSDDGVDPDPDDNGDAKGPGEDDPTVANFGENPAIGVAKDIISIVSNGDGSFSITYGLVVENIGNVVLNNVQLEENLDGTFGAGNFTVTSLTSPTLTPNPNFDASTDINLLAETDTLAVGDSANVQLVVNVTPPDLSTDYENQVRATGTSPGGAPVDDLSDDGAEPDPNGNGNAKEPGEDDPTVLRFEPNLRLLKRITDARRGGQPIENVNFDSFINDSDVAADLNTAGLTPTGVTQIEPNNPLESGDEVEYTIYFISDGAEPVANVKLCDTIPQGTDFVPGSIALNVPTALGNPTPNFVSELNVNPPFSSPPCSDASNSNGAVLVDLGDIPSNRPDNVGFVRFRVRVE